ncbi:MAG: hypothetical protein MR308_01875 [Lachnospiraceae bacterium]|nr:hypothetical protein [Lachnospiraceae bacterium]
MVSVMTGGIIDENGQYYTSVQSGVPGAEGCCRPGKLRHLRTAGKIR